MLLQDYVAATGCCKPGYAVRPRTDHRVLPGEFHSNDLYQIAGTRDARPPQAMDNAEASMVPSQGILATILELAH